MTEDIVTALWKIAEDCQCDCWICDTAAKAANHIELLYTEINELRLQLVASSFPMDCTHDHDKRPLYCGECALILVESMYDRIEDKL